MDRFYVSPQTRKLIVETARSLAGVLKADPLPPLLHVHGAVFSAWIVLLIVQVSLVAADRVDLHRRLGLMGFCLPNLARLEASCPSAALLSLQIGG